MGVLTCYVYVKNQVVIDRCHGKHLDRNSTGVTNSIDEDSLQFGRTGIRIIHAGSLEWLSETLR